MRFVCIQNRTHNNRSISDISNNDRYTCNIDNRNKMLLNVNVRTMNPISIVSTYVKLSD
jgi:hypothetical protein